MDLDQGTVVANRYRISRPLGRGGMGEVFAAENIRTGRPVAIKLLRQDSKAKSSAVARFRQEARAAGSINSDHVTQVLDVEEDPEHGVVLVFELLEGESLIDRLKRTGPIGIEELWPIIEQVWMGLADAHRAGIIHRDLKPSNVFLERRPDGATRVKILDFGISKVPKEVGGETLTEMGQSLGTFSFMPPEQIGKAKTVDHRADIYASATLIYQSLTGQLPYNARNILVMVEMKTKTDARKLGDAMSSPVDPRLEAFVARGLSRDPSQRFQTALEALNAWRELRPAGPVSTQPASAPPGSGGVVSRPRSQPPMHPVTMMGTSPANPVSLPRQAPLIVDSGKPLPRVHNDLIEMTTDETAATLAMPMPHLKKGPPAPSTPPLAPRLGSAAASIGSAGASVGAAQAAPGDEAGLARQGPMPAPQAAPDPRSALPSEPPVGPGGTQVVGRAQDHLADRRARADQAEELRAGNLPAHPAGSYLPPAVRASLARAAGTDPRGHAPAPRGHAELASHVGAVSRPPGETGPTGLPRVYEDTPPGQSGGETEVRTQLYRPAEDAARQSRLPVTMGEAPKPPAQPAKSTVPLVLVLLGFLLVGFVVVAGVMVIFKH